MAWSRRPLTDKQLDYALADVTHLRDLFPILREKLAKKGREAWLAEARDQYGAAGEGKTEDPAVEAVRTKLKLAEEIAQLGDPVLLQQRIESDPDDHRARYDLALIAQAKGDRQTAAGHLLEIIRRDRSFDDDAARTKLLEFFQAWGPTDPATKDARRRLSGLLFS